MKNVAVREMEGRNGGEQSRTWQCGRTKHGSGLRGWRKATRATVTMQIHLQTQVPALVPWLPLCAKTSKC